MPTRLSPPVLYLLLIAQVVSSDGSTVRYVVSRRQSFDEYCAFTGRLLFTYSAPTLSACSVLCATDDACVMFSYAPVTSQETAACTGYVEATTGTTLVVMPARLYSVKRSVASSTAAADAGAQTTDSALLMAGSVSVEQIPSRDEGVLTDVTAPSTAQSSAFARTFYYHKGDDRWGVNSDDIIDKKH